MATVIVDDRDANVTLKGSGWNFGGNNQEYSNTTSYSSTPNSTLSLTFYGSGVQAFATLRQWYGPTYVTFTIDGQPVGYFTSTTGENTVYHQSILDLPTTSTLGLSLALDTPHTLVMTIMSAQSNASVFVDYFLVTVPDTTAGTAPSTVTYAPYKGQTLFVDDASGLITYSGSWNPKAGTLQSFSRTAHAASGASSTNGNWTQQPAGADTPSAELTIPGTGLTIYASIPLGVTGKLCNFELVQIGAGDEGPPTDSAFSYTLTSDMLSTIGMNASTGVALNVPVLSIPEGKLGQISASQDLAEWQLTIYPQDTAFALDYIAVLGFTGALSPNATTTSPSGSSSGSSSGSAPSPSSASGKNASHVGGIVGGVIGGLAGVGLLVLLALYCIRRGGRGGTLNPMVRARAMAVSKRTSLPGEAKPGEGEVEAGIDLRNMEDARELEI